MRPCVRPCMRPFTFSKIFFSETAWPIKAKFYVEHPCVGGTKVCVFLFCSDENSGCYGNFKFSIELYEKWKLAFSVVRLWIFEFCFYINVYWVVLHV